jgi:hypothetical protein
LKEKHTQFPDMSAGIAAYESGLHNAVIRKVYVPNNSTAPPQTWLVFEDSSA